MRLHELMTELDELEPDEKLQWLVEFANELPPISSGRSETPPIKSRLYFLATRSLRAGETTLVALFQALKSRIAGSAEIPHEGC